MNDEENKNVGKGNPAYDLMPDSIKVQMPELYATDGMLKGDMIAYARYFFPMGAYTAYLLEYDPEERLGFGLATMGYGWEFGYMSLDEMEKVENYGLHIERDLWFSPTKLYQIDELKDFVQGQYTKEELSQKETKQETPPKKKGGRKL